MSQLLIAYKLPVGKVPGLIRASIPIRRFFRSSIDPFPEYVKESAIQKYLAEVDGGDFALTLIFLKQDLAINLMETDFDKIAASLTAKRGAAHEFFTNQEKSKYLEQLRKLKLTQSQESNFIEKNLEMTISDSSRRYAISLISEVVHVLDMADEQHAILMVVG